MFALITQKFKQISFSIEKFNQEVHMEWQALKTLLPLRAVRCGSALIAKVFLSYNLESLGKGPSVL